MHLHKIVVISVIIDYLCSILKSQIFLLNSIIQKKNKQNKEKRHLFILYGKGFFLSFNSVLKLYFLYEACIRKFHNFEILNCYTL